MTDPNPEAPPPSDPAHGRRVLRVILVTQLVVALLTGLGVVLGYRHLNGNLDVGPAIVHVVTKSPTKSEAPHEPLNILVLGSDSRAGAGNTIDSETGGGGSDTTILIHVSADRQDTYGVSLPRDALVDRPDCDDGSGGTVPGEQNAMFNTAFSVGGDTCTVRMVEKLTGIYIDHYVTFDFNGFVDMVDAVHGVTVCIPKDVDDRAHGITFDAGTQELSGPQALDYVRERYVLSPNSDIGRMKRQQAFIASMINKVKSAGTLARVDRVAAFLNAFTKSIKLDPDLDSVGNLADLAMQFRNTGLTNIKFVTVPFEPYEPDPNRLVWAPEAAALWKLIRNDQPLSKELSDQVISADDGVGTPSGSLSSGASQDAAAQAAANGLCA